jgi:TPR repeat protein
MKSNIFIGLMMSATILAWIPSQALSDPVDVFFEPPVIPVGAEKICATNSSDAALVAEWTAWNRKALPKKSASNISKDVNRLRNVDAAKHKETILRIIELLPKIKKSYGEADMLVDKVKLLVAAGDVAGVRDQGLVSRLLALGTTDPGQTNTLSDFVLQGLAPGVTAENGLKLKLKAALGGSPEAILDLVERVQAGEKIKGWEIDSKLAVNLAYGTLIGNLDDNVCERIARVARDFDTGKIVAKKPEIAVKWYRVGADLGDKRAAWKVAQHYIDGEFVKVDAQVVFKYLDMAVAGKNDAAIVALGNMYEEGALAERNTAKALALYDQALELKNPVALVKKVKLLSKLYQSSPELRIKYEQSLQKLYESDNPPAWSVMRMSRLLQEREGFWKSLVQSKALLEKAVALGDSESRIDLAEILISDNQSQADRQKAVDLLAQAVKSDGDVRAVENLARFYSCIEPNAQLESYWNGVKDAMGNDNVETGIGELASLSVEKDIQKIAALQTQSLYGRGSSIAIFRRYLALQPDSQATQEFWALRANEARNGMLEEIYAEFQGNLQLGRKDLARQSIKPISTLVNPSAGIAMARFLVENFANDVSSRELAKELVEPLARNGYGQAIKLLLSLDSTQKLTDYSDVMQSRGDMLSQLILAERSNNSAERKIYLRRAAGSQRCDYNDAVTFGEYALRLDPVQASQWLELAVRLSKSNHWLEVKVADLYMSAGTERAKQRALDLYQRGHDAQENSASFRLVKYYSDKSQRDYDPQKASDIFVDLINRSELKDLPERLAMLKNMKQEIRQQVSLRLNISQLYQKAAESNQPVAMREYGKILRDGNASTGATEAFNWFLRAASLNDSESMFIVSQSYAFGIGVPASEEQARDWMIKSANAGFAEALKLRALMSKATEG